MVSNSRAGPYNTHQEVYAMRTNIVLDPDIVNEALQATGARTMREVVDMALRELVARHRQRGLKTLVGKNLIAPAYDVRKVRRAMNRGTG
jgi:Arc/MetJ family transcription regulator